MKVQIVVKMIITNPVISCIQITIVIFIPTNYDSIPVKTVIINHLMNSNDIIRYTCSMHKLMAHVMMSWLSVTQLE